MVEPARAQSQALNPLYDLKFKFHALSGNVRPLVCRSGVPAQTVLLGHASRRLLRLHPLRSSHEIPRALPRCRTPGTCAEQLHGLCHGLQRKRAARPLVILPSGYKMCAPGALSFTRLEAFA